VPKYKHEKIIEIDMVKINKHWYQIITIQGNYALIQIGKAKICYKILGLEIINKPITTLF
jgi:hypothetical protein